jgi:hypothetical protein
MPSFTQHLAGYVRLQTSFCCSGISLVCTNRVLFLRKVHLYKAGDTERMESIHHRGEGGMDSRNQRTYRRPPRIGRLAEAHSESSACHNNLMIRL